MTGDNTYRQVLSTRNQFTSDNYTLEGLRGIASRSPKLEYLRFTNTYVDRYNPINSFRLITTLVRAEYTPLGDYEIPNHVELLNNTAWKITSSRVTPGSSYKWPIVSPNGCFNVDNTTYNPYVKFSAAYDTLFWGQYNPSNPNQNISWSYTPLTASFRYFEPGSTVTTSVTVPLIVSSSGYAVDAQSSRILSTPLYDSRGNLNAERELIQVSGTYPWRVIKFIHQQGALEYEVVTTLENLSDN